MRRLGILAHYNPDRVVAPYVLYHLRKLRPVCQRLVLVSNSPLDDQSRDEAARYADTIIERPNTGYDFAAWRDALRHEDIAGWDELLLTNSSIFGPLFELEILFARMSGRVCDFWGLTRNQDIAPHLQSYFLCFRNTVLRSRAWRDFWSGVADYASKDDVIREYETRLTGFLEQAGFKSEDAVGPMKFKGRDRYCWTRRSTLIPKWRLTDRNNSDLTLFAAPYLVRAGMPYFKATLVWGTQSRRRPKDIEEIQSVPGVIYDWGLLDSASAGVRLERVEYSVSKSRDGTDVSR
jgi:rhamnosyltransferase